MDKQSPIKLSIPHLTGKEKEYASEAIDSTWITPLGPYVDRFESMLCDYLDCNNIVALSSGTAAIHLALADLGVGHDDTVICQSMTFAASANPIIYLGAKPIFIDSEPDTWNMSPKLLDEALTKLDKKPKAIIIVDLYGMPAKHNELKAIANHYGITVIEDSAEALGSEYNGRKCGTIYPYGVFSFNGNKMITTSGGGALKCPNDISDKHIRHLATQARENRPYYWHEEIGFNYRLSNVSAAIGCAQAEELENRVSRRREIHDIYTSLFNDNPFIEVHNNPSTEFKSNFWLTTILLSPDCIMSPDDLRKKLLDENIETRLLWKPMHSQPIYKNAQSFIDGTSDSLFNRGLCLPSSSCMSDSDIARVAEAINRHSVTTSK